VVEYIVNKFARLLPHEKCAHCKQPVIDAIKKGEKQADPAERAFCGHWFHSSCLEHVMTKPPFGMQCPGDGCDSRVFHPKWTSDVKTLERRWAAAQARQREVDDARDFLGL